jgi:hypothetical protein
MQEQEVSKKEGLDTAAQIARKVKWCDEQLKEKWEGKKLQLYLGKLSLEVFEGVKKELGKEWSLSAYRLKFDKCHFYFYSKLNNLKEKAEL